MPCPLLVVTVDRLPAWMLPAYGGTWVAMPALCRLAARGVVFDGLVATTDAPGATAGHILGGVIGRGRRVAVVTDEASIAEGLFAASDIAVVPVATGVRQADGEANTNLGRLFAAAAAAVASRQHDVVWCHAGSLAQSWDAPESFRDAYLDPEDPPPPPGAAVAGFDVTPATDPDLVTGVRHVFAGQLTLLDQCLGGLLEAVAEGSHILVVGLRGMPLGLHGRVGPGPLPPYAELVRLPAILVDGFGRMAGQRFGGLVIPADLGATLVDEELAPVAAVPDAGRSLDALFEAWGFAGRDRVVVDAAHGQAVATPWWHLVRIPGDEPTMRLFARPDDFFDRCDVANRCRALVEDLTPLVEAVAAGDAARAWGMPLSAGGQPAD